MTDTSTVFEAGARRLRVWIVFGAVGVFAVAMAWLAWSSAQSYGLAAADGGELAPLTTRLVLAAFIAAIGIAPLLGMYVYARCYVVQLEYDRGSETLLFHTLLGPATTPLARLQLESVSYNAGRYPDSTTQRAPWTTLRVRGRSLPYLVDMQGNVLDRDAWRSLARQHQIDDDDNEDDDSSS